MNSLLVLLQTLGLGAGFAAVLFYLGFGPTHWLLPAPLRAWRLLVIPFVGIALVVVWDYLALFLNLDLTVATLALLVVATVVNVLALRSIRRAPREQHAPWGRIEWALLAAAALFFLAGIAPLIRYGYNTLIGENWDYEFYLILADTLRTLPTSALAQAPSNPLLNVVLSRHILPLPMGFSYLHSSLDVIFNLQAFDSFTVLVTLLRALGVISPFVFFRATLKMSPRASLVAVALFAINGLLLWATYWNYGLHLASLALLPISLVLCAHALITRDWRSLPLAGLLLAALNVTFHPTLIAALLPLGLVGLYALAALPNRVRTLAQGIALLALGALLSFPTLFHIADFQREYYGREPLAAGLRAFIPLSDALGLSNYTLELIVGHTIPTPFLYNLAARLWDLAAPVLLVVALAVSLLGLIRRWHDPERRALWYIFTGAAIVYVAIFRLPFLHPYPYGFLKSLTIVSYLFLGLSIQGTQDLLQLAGYKSQDAERRALAAISNHQLPVTIIRYAALSLSLCFVALTLLTFGLTIEQYFKPLPVFFTADDLKLRTLAGMLPNGSNVFLTDRQEVQKVPMALAAYALRSYPLRGRAETGYGDLTDKLSGAVYDYALLARGEDPAGRGYAGPPLWTNDRFALYPRAPGVAFHHNLNAYTDTGRPLDWIVNAKEVISGTQTVPPASGTREVRIALASFAPQTVSVNLGGQERSLQLMPGLSVYRIPQAALPARLSVVPGSPAQSPQTLPAGPQAATVDVTLFMPWIETGTGAGTGEPALSPSNALLVHCLGGSPENLNIRCSVANPAGANLRWAWVVRGTPKGTEEDQALMQQSVSGSPRRAIDLTAGFREGLTAVALDDVQVSISGNTSRLGDGNYRASLDIYRDALLIAQIDLYKFNITQGATSFKRSAPSDLPLVIAQP